MLCDDVFDVHNNISQHQDTYWVLCSVLSHTHMYHLKDS